MRGLAQKGRAAIWANSRSAPVELPHDNYFAIFASLFSRKLDGLTELLEDAAPPRPPGHKFRENGAAAKTHGRAFVYFSRLGTALPWMGGCIIVNRACCQDGSDDV